MAAYQNCNLRDDLACSIALGLATGCITVGQPRNSPEPDYFPVVHNPTGITSFGAICTPGELIIIYGFSEFWVVSHAGMRGTSLDSTSFVYLPEPSSSTHHTRNAVAMSVPKTWAV